MTEKNYSKNKNQIYDVLFLLCVIPFICIVMQLNGITCPVKYLTGVSCPGCGMTRAYMRLCMLDIKGAFYYHPLFFIPPVILAVYAMRRRIPKRAMRLILSATAFIFVIIYMIRLFSPENDIVVFRPEEGMIYEIFHFIFGNR